MKSIELYFTIHRFVNIKGNVFSRSYRHVLSNYFRHGLKKDNSVLKLQLIMTKTFVIKNQAASSASGYLCERIHG